ncbi:MAG: DHA2 family efflux MFS transporter permease subunit, partial [Gammaproteobacteria bacterium]|nr:DHA2 family efflux MFS transporter permease subunit [Gammaproteobacteria bacterium]
MSTLQSANQNQAAANKWLVTFAGISGSVAMVLSATIVNVAIPSVMGAYGVGQDRAQWLATAFIATMVASQLVSAWFASALGVRLAFLVINCVFLAGTAITVTSPSLDLLIVGRVMQGFAAGTVQPMVMAMIFRLFPPERRGTAMGVYGMGIQIAPMLGPMFGGLVIDALGWREIFLVPVPICLISLLLGMLYLPGREQSGKLPRFDWSGYALLCTSLVLLLAAGANGQRYGWGSDTLLLMVVVGLGAGIWFVVLQLKSADPLLDFSLFLIPQFASAVMVSFVFGIGNFASNYLIPVYVQQVQGFSASLAGFMLLPAGLLVISGTPIFGRAADFLPAHLMVMIGISLFAFGNFLMSRTDVNTSFLSFVLFIVVARSGMALIMPSLSTAALRALTPAQLNKGSGTVNFCRQFGGAFGITALVVFMEQRTQFHGEALTATQTSDNPTSRELLDTVGNLLAEGGVPEAA